MDLLVRLPGHLTGHLFPRDAIPYLNVLAQVAVVIFMFAVGYEIEFGALHAHGRAVPFVALGALLVPMGLGIGCALLFRPEFAQCHLDYLPLSPQGRHWELEPQKSQAFRRRCCPATGGRTFP